MKTFYYISNVVLIILGLAVGSVLICTNAPWWLFTLITVMVFVGGASGAFGLAARLEE